MDRPTTRTEADARSSRAGPHEAFVLPSRRPALELCRGAARPGAGPPGPVLVTGDPGVGKTWLWRTLEAESAPGCRWVGVDLTPADGPADFYRLIAHELGLTGAGVGSRSPAPSRVAVVDDLAERSVGGERLTLVVEEAHNLSPDVWEEVRVLANRLDRPGGFARMILVGQSSLAVRFGTRPFAAIEARLASRVHLGPIDADEAKDLLDRLRPGRDWPIEEVEALHRDASGNPRRILRRVAPLVGAAEVPARTLATKAPASIEPPRVAPAPAPKAESTAPALIGPGRPPIRVEENMIEVGWSPDEAVAPTSGDSAVVHGPRRLGQPAPSEGGEEAVRDHLAALQAWREWAENQARQAPTTPTPIPAAVVPDSEFEDEDEDEDEIEDDEADGLEFPGPSRVDRPTVRAEGEQKFAPFGHLFSRMAQATEPE